MPIEQPKVAERSVCAMRVLVADDSATVRTIIRRSLQALGVREMVEASDGQQAVELFQQGGIDLVLTDWNMPGKTGVEVTREIRAMDRKVPIIMVTTEAEKSHVLEAVAAGASDYLIKPFMTDVLEQKLWRFAARA
jgi:two-component system, chemotaxis family, chemotaxis protein CheY